MQIKHVTITLDFYRRVVLYPEGGINVEYLEPGIGWVLDTEAEVDDTALSNLLTRARNIVACAAKLCSVKVSGMEGGE